jgi:arsenite methyltransferase
VTHADTTLPAALRRAPELFTQRPAQPDVSNGYLDLLGAAPVAEESMAKNTGAIQAAWASPIGSMLYHKPPSHVATAVHAFQEPTEWLKVSVSKRRTSVNDHEIRTQIHEQPVTE